MGRVTCLAKTGSFSGVLRCHTSLPSSVSSWKLFELSPFCSDGVFILGFGGGAGGVTFVGFFGFGRVGGGCFLAIVPEMWSFTGSSSGMV